MTNKRINLKFDSKSIIIDLMLAALVFLSTVPIATYIDGYTPSYQVPYIIMITGLIPVSLSSIVRHIDMTNVYKVIAQTIIFAIHSAIVISYYLVTIHWIVLVILVAINFIYAMFITNKPPKGKIKYTSLLFAVITNLGFYVAFTYDERIINVTGLIVNVYLALLFFIIARQVNEFEESYYHSIESSMLPTKEITKQNKKTVFTAIICFGIAILMLFMPPFSTIISFVSYLLKLLLGQIPTDSFNSNELEHEEVSDGIVIYEKTKDVPVLRIMLVILFAILAILTIVLIILALRNKSNTNQVMVKSNSEVTDVIEKIRHEKSRLRRANNFGTGYEMKIRKRFYKKVQKSIYKGALIKGSYTPSEIAEAVNTINPESITELKNEYEKVRYN